MTFWQYMEYRGLETVIGLGIVLIVVVVYLIARTGAWLWEQFFK